MADCLHGLLLPTMQLKRFQRGAGLLCVNARGVDLFFLDKYPSSVRRFFPTRCMCVVASQSLAYDRPFYTMPSEEQPPGAIKYFLADTPTCGCWASGQA